MNIRTKTTIVLVVTLFTGILIGTFLSGSLIRSQMRRKFQDRNPRMMFQNRFERIIEPYPEQKTAVDSIFCQHSREIARIDSSIRLQFQSALDSLQADLYPILNASQNQRIAQAIERMKCFHEKMREPKHGHHFDGDFRPRTRTKEGHHIPGRMRNSQ